MSGDGRCNQENTNVKAVLGLDEYARSPRRWRWLAIAGCVIAVAIGSYVYLGNTGAGGSIHYVTESANLGDLTVIVTATGTVQPTNQVDVSSEVHPQPPEYARWNSNRLSHAQYIGDDIQLYQVGLWY